MQILFIVGSFPALSETFIFNQITGLIDRGHEVDTYSLNRLNRYITTRYTQRYPKMKQIQPAMQV